MKNTMRGEGDRGIGRRSGIGEQGNRKDRRVREERAGRGKGESKI